MLDEEKLRKLYQAALKEPAAPSANPSGQTIPVKGAAVTTTPSVSPNPPVSQIVAEPDPGNEPVATTVKAPVLDDAASAELAVLLDERLLRQARKRRRAALITALVYLALFGAGGAWFAQSPARLQACMEAIQDLRSVGDVKSLVGKYQTVMDRMAVRSQQIEQSTAAMGGTKSAADDKDPTMEAEMKTLTGGEGKTVDQRNKQLQTTFGQMEKNNGVEIKAKATMTKDNSFDPGN